MQEFGGACQFQPNFLFFKMTLQKRHNGFCRVSSYRLAPHFVIFIIPKRLSIQVGSRISETFSVLSQFPTNTYVPVPCCQINPIQEGLASVRDVHAELPLSLLPTP
jgi:S-methylmethionine-dependent homocysteine/selenocysteine methylase